MDFVSPLSLSPEDRARNAAALQDRVAGVMGRVAADSSLSGRVRAANERDAAAARVLAARMRAVASR